MLLESLFNIKKYLNFYDKAILRVNKFQSDFLAELTDRWLLSPSVKSHKSLRRTAFWRAETTSERLFAAKAGKESERVGEEVAGRNSRKIPLESDAAAVTHFTSRLVVAVSFASFPSLLEFFRLFAPTLYTTCRRYDARALRLQRYTRALVGARDIRGSQFIFPADFSKNFLRLGYVVPTSYERRPALEASLVEQYSCNFSLLFLR